MFQPASAFMLMAQFEIPPGFNAGELMMSWISRRTTHN
jgi:hypothetical protein